MDNYEYAELLKTLQTKCDNIESIVQVAQKQERLAAILRLQDDASFWNDADKSAAILKEKRQLERILEKYNASKSALSDSVELFEIAQAENDAEILASLFADSDTLQSCVRNLEIEVMLSGEHDNANAILTIHPGAGGTESQDWANMVYRMYLRYCERKGFAAEILDYQEGEEAGIKDASLLIKGDSAYGYLKVESGIHRLVRISPFDSNGRRHTSFCSVVVTPEIEDTIAIEIAEKDLRIDTYRASGAGGQHVNKTESAIRITHLPSGIVVQCQNDRSQHKNKATALKMLRSRLYELERLKKSPTSSQPTTEIAWGHQIRNYVLYPYQQIKDTRSNQAFSDTTAILDGDLQSLIEGVLIAQAQTQ
ncbi:MAG: peptide chain release factor 2 [Helicobacter sp.]|nr:peptide chain release factor 2 [Helicobacter sp.]